MVRLPSIHWSKPPFLFFDIRALWRSVLRARVPECQKIKKDVSDQYGLERLDGLIYATIRKMCRARSDWSLERQDVAYRQT